MATGIVLVAPPFVAGVLGPDWTGMVPAMRVLAVWGFVRALAALCGPLFRAVDHPEYSTGMQLSRLLLLGAFLYPATTHWGIAGAALAVVGSALLQTPVAIALALRVVDASPTRLLETLVSPVAATVPMVLAVSVAGTLPLTPTLRFVVMVLVGAPTYVGALFVYDRTVGIGLDRDLATVREAFG
jgi:PST family polysaccharide transporter/lipopolysaccharide exporter